MNPQIWWYLSRSTGLVAWGLSAASILIGLALATRALGPNPKGPWLLSLHRWVSGLTILFVGAHIGALVADTFVHFGTADVLVPWASSWKPTQVAWGIIAAWLLVAIELTSLQMRHLPKRVWHGIHLTSYLVALLATVHGVTAGTDASNPVFAWSMLAAMAGMAFFVTYRKLVPKKAARSPRVPQQPALRGPRSPREMTGTGARRGDR
jgi:DMSO/TMAO reductase YedYZ heme-binding membrane subunit